MNQWYYLQEGTEYGPCSEQQLAALLKEKTIRPLDQVRTDSSSEWAYPGEIDEFKEVLSKRDRIVATLYSHLEKKSPLANEDIKWEDVKSLLIKAAFALISMAIAYGLLYLVTGSVPNKIPVPVR